MAEKLFTPTCSAISLLSSSSPRETSVRSGVMDDYVQVSYKERASLYAAEYTDTVDFDFLRSFVTPAVTSILEIPSGVGRNVMNMATTGCSIVAVDREPEMVRFLEERIRSSQPKSNVEALVGDLTTLDLDKVFDLILVPREAFQLLTSQDASRQALLSLKKHLSQRGILIIDLSPFSHSPAAAHDLRPDYYNPMLPDGVWNFDWERQANAQVRFSREHLQRHHKDDDLEIRFRYHITGESGQSYLTETSTSFTIYTQESFNGLAASCGFSISACYGDYHFKPFETGDPRMIFCLTLPDEHQPGSSLKLSRGFSNEVDAYRITDFANVEVRPDILSYFQGYMDSYFSGPFVEAQGAEHILTAMHRFGGPGDALDLGAGTSTLFWYTPVVDLNSITCADIAPEPLLILKHFIEGSSLPECYQWSVGHFNLESNHIRKIRSAVRDYIVFDTLTRWPTMLDSYGFDLITAFGNIAISSSSSQYRSVFAEIARHLRPGGRTIGADWIRRPEFMNASGHNNSYLDLSLVRSSIEGAGLRLLECEQISIEGDQFYEGIIYWAAAR
ncbi:methyltransferase domain-containing protein [Agrobacterium vitis]|nr:class I SAM-dependent methyltransferase [Allorhizobium ampelinum]MCF1496178.1 class I SAM-dependent methyltransferase [Allorhizobium ampelinum]MVA48904.1 methyltransferase domain-containing protein [Agrobacterium vitis]